MKILIACSTLDLRYHLGCTPSWWQLFKALYENGHEVIVIPYLGDPVESLWWRTYPNPCSWESKLYNRYLITRKTHSQISKYNEKADSFLNRFAERYVHEKWEKHLISILNVEKNVDAVLFMNIPLNHIKGIASDIKNQYSIPIGYFDGDMPTILPKYAINRGFKFNYYVNANLSEFDVFFTNSKGVIPDIQELGAQNVHTIYYAADPDVFKPIDIQKDIDVSFFGYGSSFREEWMTYLISKPSQIMPNSIFSVAGGEFYIDLCRANHVGDLSFSNYRRYCCRSKICLNITRWSHTSVYASSTARPFELAAFGACIVSQPYKGIEEWFKPGSELIIVESEEEIIPIYEQLLDSDNEREKIGERSRMRIIKDHTFTNRAEKIISGFRNSK